MATRPRIVVVGVGIVGASIARHLAADGADVTVLDAAAPGGVATPASFAWINASWGNPEHYVRLRMRSMAEWRRLEAAVPAICVSWCGGLGWDLPPDRLLDFAREHAGWGYGVRTVGRAEAVALEPNLASPPELAVHVAAEGAVEPARAACALLEDARTHGARLLRTTALGLEQGGGQVRGLATGDGFLPADEVVVAAGAGTPALLATAGVELRLDAPPGLLVHTRPHAKLLNGIVLAPELHMRQSDEGRIVVGSDFGGADPGPDADATAQALLAQARAMLVGGERIAFEGCTIGLRPTPADGFPVIGRPEDRAGLYVAVMHSGVTLAAAVGLLVTRELGCGRRDPLLAPFGAREGVMR